MDAINTLITSILDALLAPLAAHPAVALVLISVVSGVVMTLVFRLTSRQAQLRRVADDAKAQLLCMRLFRDDLLVAFRSQAALLGTVVRRLWYSLPPLLVLTIPFAVLLTQLGARYEHRPLTTGESVVVEVHLTPESWETGRSAQLVLPDGIRRETPVVRDREAHVLAWRLGVERVVADAVLRVDVNGADVAKELPTSVDKAALRSINVRRTDDRWEQWLYPGERVLPKDGPVRAIEVHHPRRTTRVWGVDVPWWGTLLIVSMVTALVVGRVFRVQF